MRLSRRWLFFLWSCSFGTTDNENNIRRWCVTIHTRPYVLMGGGYYRYGGENDMTTAAELFYVL